MSGSPPVLSSQRPVLPPEIIQFFIPLRAAQPKESRLLYQPMAFGSAKVYFVDHKAKVDEEQTVAILAPITDQAVAVDWGEASGVDLVDSDLEKDPAAEATYAALSTSFTKVKSHGFLETFLNGCALSHAETRIVSQFKSQSNLEGRRI